MRNNLTLSIFLILLLNSCQVSQHKAVNTAKLKKEATEFSLQIVKSYFDEASDQLYSSMNDSLMLMDGDGVIAKKGKADKLCISIKRAVRDKEKTYEDYLESYQIEILSLTEFEQKFNFKLPPYFMASQNNYFFIGHELKQAENTSSDFIWDDLFIFMVNKENKFWTIAGLSG